MNRLSFIRKKYKVTQKKLSEHIDISTRTIQNIEKNIKTPSVLIALKIAKYFNCKVEDIFDYNTENERSNKNE